ncbi:MAG: hypothetical protein KKD77_21150 [Gammaproteobacteria bacterium]|nr:hypothetical protein [Gammaproteobacteria bacterium]
MNLKTARNLAIDYDLSGPDWALDPKIPIEEIRERIKSEGGCGPGKFGDWLVPDTVWFINIKPACYLHDCQYSEADTPEKRYAADKNLFNNAEKIIRLKSRNKFTLWLRMSRLMKYYAAVDIAGGGFSKN